MNLIICGGRDEYLFSKRLDWLNRTLGDLSIQTLINGGAQGIDNDALGWARARGIDTVIFPPNWQLHGKAAGPIRNKKMLKYLLFLGGELLGSECLVIAFPGGKGTADMCQQASAHGIRVIRYIGSEENI